LPPPVSTELPMNYVFWLIGVIVVVIAILSFLGLR
jgi:hypothetical protein